jgi:HD domain-containing protein
MKKEDLDKMKRWFERYVQKFKTDDSEQRGSEQKKNVILKEVHTRRVCQEILSIGKDLGLGEEDLRLAELLALFHDVGRFSQYARYGTFADSQSEDHAALGAKVLREEGVLNGFDEATRDLILRVVFYHNKKSLPESETERCLFFSRLLRDADKLDVLRILTGYYREKDGKKNPSLELRLEDSPGISRKVRQEMMEGKLIDISNLRCLNDFKVLQISWIYDINFAPTFRSLRERNYLQMILDTLPRSDWVEEISSLVEARLEEGVRK